MSNAFHAQGAVNRICNDMHEGSESVADQHADQPLAERLKESTRSAHDTVNHAVMNYDPFNDLERYKQFLQVQYLFHQVLLPYYHDEELNQLLPGLSNLRRFEALATDLDDLGVTVPSLPVTARITTKSTAVGWLYCSEGSNIGAAFLFKASQKMGMDAEHGARHLAAAPEGRARHWKAFVAQLNALPFDDQQKKEAINGAHDAFDFYRQTVAQLMV